MALIDQDEVDKKKIQNFLTWIEKDLPGLTNSILKAHKPEEKTSEKTTEKPPEKKEEKKPERKVSGEILGKRETPAQGSILDRVVPHSDAPPIRKNSQTDGEKDDKKKKDPTKTRCSFWPNCKNKDCPYVHPKEQVG